MPSRPAVQPTTGAMSTPPADPDWVPVSPLLPDDPPRVGDFWLDARLGRRRVGCRLHRPRPPTAPQRDGHRAVRGRGGGRRGPRPAGRRGQRDAHRHRAGPRRARAGLRSAGAQVRRRRRRPRPPDGGLLAPWVALAYDGSPAAAAEAARILDEVQLATLAPQGRAERPRLPALLAGPGQARAGPPVAAALAGPLRPGRLETILVSWLLMLLLAALAVLIAILIFRNQPPQTPPTPTGGSGSPPPSQSGSPPPQSGSPSPQSGSRRPASRGRSPAARRGRRRAAVRVPVGLRLGVRLGLPVTERHRERRRPAQPGRVRLTGRQHARPRGCRRARERCPRGRIRRVRTPKLIATDLDGTFLSPDESVSAENSAAVLAAQEAGITVVFATGRPIRWLEVIRGPARRAPDGDRQQRRGPLRRRGRRDDRPDHHRHRRGAGGGGAHPRGRRRMSGSPSSRAPGSATSRTT